VEVCVLRKSLVLCLFLVFLAGPALAWTEQYAPQREQWTAAQAALAAGQKENAGAIFKDLAGSDWPAADLAAVAVREIDRAAGHDAGVDYWNRYLVEHFPHSRHRPTALAALVRGMLKREGQGKAALELVRKMENDHPGQIVPTTAYLLGEALMRTGNPKQAAAAYAEAATWHTGDDAKAAARKLAGLASAGIARPKPAPETMWAKIEANMAIRFHWTAGMLAGRAARIYAGTETGFRAKLIVIDMLTARRKHKEAKKALQNLAKQAGKGDRQLAVQIRLQRYLKKTNAQKRAFYVAATKKPASWAARADALQALHYLDWGNREWAKAAGWSDKLMANHADDVFLPEEFLWRAGFGYYLAGDFASSGERLTRFVDAYPKHKDHDRASYWLGRARERAGDKDGAVHAFQACFDRWQSTYYGVAAQERLLVLGVPRFRLPQIPFTDETKLVIAKATGLPTLNAKWEQAGGGGEARDAGAMAAIDRYAQHADAPFSSAFANLRELLDLGEREEAEKLLDFWKDDLYRSADGGYFLSVGYGLVGDNLSSIRAAYAALEKVRDNRLADPHGMISRRRFPKIEEKMISTTAKKHNLDPLLVLGVIKQESAFQMRATSSAGARGLMQVMPGTGQYIARRRGIKNFNAKQLYRPEVSLDYGCWLLSMLYHDRFTGDLPASLAGYNAGWGRPPQWWPPNVGRNYDELIELIPFNETRGYVKGILRNYEMYQRLYGDPVTGVKNRPSVFTLLSKKVTGLP
jgi:peptidoglycan lytic transglycosylase